MPRELWELSVLQPAGATENSCKYLQSLQQGADMSRYVGCISFICRNYDMLYGCICKDPVHICDGKCNHFEPFVQEQQP